MPESGECDFLCVGAVLRSENSHDLALGLLCRDRLDVEEEIERRSRMGIVAVVADDARGFARMICFHCVEVVVGAVCRISIVGGVLVARRTNCGDDAEQAMAIEQ